MLRRVACSLVGVTAAFLAVVGTSSAGVQCKEYVCWLGAGDWQLREEQGEAYLIERPLRQRPARGNRHRWLVSAPTIKSERSDRFLAYSLKGREPKVYLSDEKGKHARWLFEIDKRLRPSRDSDCKNGPVGFTFRVIAAEGEFRDWYLAAEDAPQGGKERKDRE